MPRPQRVAWRAACVLSLIWLMTGPAARHAEAQGCHVAERPTLGREDDGWLRGEPLNLLYDTPNEAPVARLGHLPCSQTLPGSAPIPVVPDSPLLATPEPRARADTGRRWPPASSPCSRPITLAETPERPPRVATSRSTWIL